MSNTIEQIIEATPNLAGLIQDNSSSREEVVAEYEAIIALAREGMVATPSLPREVWGVQVGTWPVYHYQSEEIARFHAMHPDTGKVGGALYPVRLMRGTAFSTVWEVVE